MSESVPMWKVAYALNQWQALNHYLDDGRLAIDNNLVERSRPPRPLAPAGHHWPDDYRVYNPRMRATPECPRCQGSMESGYIIDHTQHASSVVQTWFRGEPEKSFWTGLKTKKRSHRQVRTFRCTRCGYLESYAA